MKKVFVNKCAKTQRKAKHGAWTDRPQADERQKAPGLGEASEQREARARGCLW